MNCWIKIGFAVSATATAAYYWRRKEWMKWTSTRTGKYDTGECPICDSNPQKKRSWPPCGHVFCYSCLLRSIGVDEHKHSVLVNGIGYMYEKKMKCPYCNGEFSEFEHENGKEYFNQRPPNKPFRQLADSRMAVESSFSPRDPNAFSSLGARVGRQSNPILLTLARGDSSPAAPANSTPMVSRARAPSAMNRNGVCPPHFPFPGRYRN